MRIDFRVVSASILALSLAACGSPAEEADEPAATTAETAPAAPAAAPAMADADAAMDAETADATADPAAASGAATTTQASAVAQPPIFAVCSACHSVQPGDNGIGPSLAGVYGSQSGGHSAGFEYSEAMMNANLTWDEATLDRYLEDPQGVVPGTNMSYAGLKNDEQRAAVIEYLKSI